MRLSALLATTTLAFIFSLTASAYDWRSMNEAGLGFTDNANLEDSQRDSDMFYRLSTINSYQTDAHLLGVRLAFTDYFRENRNDLLSLRLSDRWSPGGKWSYYGALAFQDYVGGEPGTTEASFDNFGVDFSMERKITLNSKTEIRFGPGGTARFYSASAHRSDFSAFGYGEIDYEVSEKVLIGGRAETGLLLSTDSDFSRFYLELVGSCDYDFAESWSVAGELGIKDSAFTSRSISTETIVSRNRGFASRSQGPSNEAYSYFYLYSELLKEFKPDLRGGLSLRTSSQSSRSGYQNFSAAELFARLIFTF
jgi:hypothetical protein